MFRFHSTSSPNVPGYCPGISPKPYPGAGRKLTLYPGATLLWPLLGLLLFGSCANAQTPANSCCSNES